MMGGGGLLRSLRGDSQSHDGGGAEAAETLVEESER